MKSHLYSIGQPVVGAVLGLAFWAVPAQAANSADKQAGSARQPAVVAAQDRTGGVRASELIGQDVTSGTGESLGQIKDLLVSPAKGKIVFALVGSGGLLGVGEEIRAVPFSAFKNAYHPEGNLTLDVDRDRWNDAPTVREEEIMSLGNRPLARTTFDYYGEKFESDLLSDAQDSSARSLMRVDELSGKQVVSAGREVGEIEGAIVDFKSRRASVVLDPNNDFAGTDHKFIVSFAQLTPSPSGEDAFTTELSREQFSQAAPAEENWWATDTGYPYIWTGYTARPGYAATPATAGPQMGATADGEVAERSSLTDVRAALRNDSDLSAAARRTTIEREGDRLVIAGTVESEAMKRKIGKTVAEAAEGWRVENRVTVDAAAE